MLKIKTQIVTKRTEEDGSVNTDRQKHSGVIIHTADELRQYIQNALDTNDLCTDGVDSLYDTAVTAMTTLSSNDENAPKTANFSYKNHEVISYEKDNEQKTVTIEKTYKFTFTNRTVGLQYKPTNKVAKAQRRHMPWHGQLVSEYVADIDFDEGVLSITDPCYYRDVWCRKDDVEIIPGEYQVNTFTNSEGRVIILQIILKDETVIDEFNSTNTNINKSWRVLSENIGVDAGLCGFFQNKPDFDDDEWSDLCQNVRYDGTGNLYEGKNPWQKGFFTESGYGDGCYSVHAIRRRVGPNNKYGIVALELRF